MGRWVHPHPRSEGPQRRRTFSLAEKLAHLAAYEQACETNGVGPIYAVRACIPR